MTCAAAAFPDLQSCERKTQQELPAPRQKMSPYQRPGREWDAARGVRGGASAPRPRAPPTSLCCCCSGPAAKSSLRGSPSRCPGFCALGKGGASTTRERRGSRGEVHQSQDRSRPVHPRLQPARCQREGNPSASSALQERLAVNRFPGTDSDFSPKSSAAGRRQPGKLKPRHLPPRLSAF